MAIPLLYAALGETVSQKSGLLNIGLEANMLSGAFFGFAVSYWTGSLAIGFLGGIAGGVLFSMIHAFLSISLGQNQSVSGTALNLFSTGLTSYLFAVLVNNASNAYPQITTLSYFPVPLLNKIPIIGEAFFNKDIITYFGYLLVLIIALFLNKTVWGKTLISVGENPQASDTAGINVNRTRYLAALFNGAMCGIGGAYLVLGQLGMFSENVTSGRGYIALSLVVFGRRKPFGVFLGALFLGIANALQYKMQAMGVKMPIQFFTGLPYIMTIAVLLFSASKTNTEPSALSKPFFRGSR